LTKRKLFASYTSFVFRYTKSPEAVFLRKLSLISGAINFEENFDPILVEIAKDKQKSNLPWRSPK